MQTIQRQEGDNWTEREAELYCEAHNLTIIAINGNSLIAVKR